MENLSDILNLDDKARIMQCKKGDIVQRAGELNPKAYFVKSGLLRSYTIDEKGKEHVFIFAPEGWVVSDLEAQQFDQKSILFIDCMEDSEIIVFDRQLLGNTDLDKEQLAENIRLLSRRVAVMQRRIIMLMSATAKERYEFFLETYPELPNRVPQRMIASYVGITPEALSKMRGEMAKAQ